MSYLRCLCFLRIVVSNTYCVVFLFCLSSSFVPYIASFSVLPFSQLPRYSLTFIYYRDNILFSLEILQLSGKKDRYYIVYDWKGFCTYSTFTLNMRSSKRNNKRPIRFIYLLNILLHYKCSYKLFDELWFILAMSV